MDYKKLSRIGDADVQLRDLVATKDAGLLLNVLKKHFPEISERLDSEFKEVVREFTSAARAAKNERQDNRLHLDDREILKKAYPDAANINFYNGRFDVQFVKSTEEEADAAVEEAAKHIPEGFKRVKSSRVKTVRDWRGNGYRSYLLLKKF